jgi:hypothetical protein
MAKKTAKEYIKATKKFIRAKRTKTKYRMREIDFIRNRKLPFEHLVLCMFTQLRRSLQSELHIFFKSLNQYSKKITASAFVQSRKKINPELFYELNQTIVSEYYTDNDETVKQYKGMRILSVDGSTINLPLTKELIEIYGYFNNQQQANNVVIGRVSVLYDVLNKIVIDGLLRPFKEGEISLSREHIEYVTKGDLLIMDRSYPSFESAYMLKEKEVNFLFRCKESFSNQVKAFCESGKKDAEIVIKAKQNKSYKHLSYNKDSTIEVRLLRIELNNGEVEILMTSLLDNKKFPYEEFINLYYQRWGVETFYDRFKNIIEVERFSGTSVQFIQQEFNCALYISNMQTILTQESEAEVKEAYKHRKYEYKINQSVSLGFIRERLIELFISKNKNEAKIIEELKQLFIINVIPVRSGRKYKREKDKYRQRTKPKQFLNRRMIC